MTKPACFRSSNAEIRSAILTGAGEKSFVAGADIKEFLELDATGGKLLAQKGQDLVFNKIDAYHYIEKEPDDLTPSKKENISLDDLKKSWLSRISGDCIFISATNKTNIHELRSLLISRVKEMHFRRYPHSVLAQHMH